MIKKIIFLFLAWRVFLFLPLAVSEIFLSPRTGYAYTLLTYFLEKGSVLSNFLLYPFGNFDASYYLLIAAKGYTVNAGFFPSFPLSIYIATWPFDVLPFDVTQYFIAIVLVSIFFLLSLLMMFKLIRLDYENNIAMSAILAILIFPTSFFYAAIYSEGLFLLLSLFAFYFARKKKWLIAGLFSGLLSATRLVGIAILPALLYEYFKNEKNKSFRKFLSIFLAPLGLISYAVYNYFKWGNPFYFIEVQGNFQNNRSVDSIVFPIQTMFRYFKILTGVNPGIYEWWVALFELLFFFFTAVMLYIGWRKRVRFSYLLFGFLCFLLPALSGTFSALPRYIAVIFPLYTTLALIKNKTFKIIYCLISVTLLFLFFMLFSKGYFIS